MFPVYKKPQQNSEIFGQCVSHILKGKLKLISNKEMGAL